jgi:hypothetical protein
MKSVLKAFLLIFILNSCTNFKTFVKVENHMPQIPDEKPFYVFFASDNTLPDSAVYIGSFSTILSMEQASFSGVMPNYKDLYSSIENNAKQAGANFAIIEKDVKKSQNNLLEGRLYLIKDFENTRFTEDSIKKLWKVKKPDKLEGIYVTDLSDFGTGYRGDLVKFAIIKKDSSNYIMVYLNGYGALYGVHGLNYMQKIWREGDISAMIQKTEKPSLYSTKRYEFNKYLSQNNMLRVDDGNLRMSCRNGLDFFWKIYPDSSKMETLMGSLTGFALDKNRIITCYHGFTDENIIIYVKGINGNFDLKYTAVVEKVDKENDIAVIRLEDTTAIINFTPFAYSDTPKEIAEDIYVLGYPISMIMGEEIKLSNGIINSTSGYGGNLNSYQISAPIQHGNSGSPLFEKNGNFIGMVNSGISKAENVGYSLKLKSINEFLTKNGYIYQSKPENTYKELSLSEKVKIFQKSIYLIEIIDPDPFLKDESSYQTKTSRRRNRR